jgi:predicted peptidase
LKIQETYDFDKSRIFVMGGSHGGFLTAHLSARYPELFAGAIMRNPVTDLPSKLPVTDRIDSRLRHAGDLGHYGLGLWPA